MRPLMLGGGRNQERVGTKPVTRGPGSDAGITPLREGVTRNLTVKEENGFALRSGDVPRLLFAGYGALPRFGRGTHDGSMSLGLSKWPGRAPCHLQPRRRPHAGAKQRSGR